MRISVRLTILVVVLVGLLVMKIHPALGQPQVGKPAPVFTLPALKGGTLSLDAYRGKHNVVVVFYRGWLGYW